MSNDQPVFSFELNESLYFEKGQEVAEMRGVSLDPEITIQSFNEYISIRGVIELSGEYHKVASTADEDDQSMDFENYHSKRYVERVVDIEEGDAEFSHRFPVEISVPTYRVNDINDVSVYIESFDYEIPDPSQLKLYSTIEIHGITDQSEESDGHEEEEQQAEALPMEREEDESFNFEIKQEKDLAHDEPELLDALDIPALQSEIDENTTEENTTEEERWKFKQQSQTLKQFFDDLSAKENDDDSPEVVDTLTPPDNEPDVSPDEDESMEDRTDEVKDVSYLSDMFRSSEEEQYEQMRLCIVQEKDTIETIAERYKITTLQLIKQNNLDEEYDVSEGQLLYIPKKK
ncbi:stage VI sporulation protein D [Virgibacillus profundi]|uniref:stage VI sporulation protein D n=1 Tax=Virgibacillus profundi TaxID=2024555 RepID=UPI001F0A3C5F|nr:stage VI sporulation protein D [Virgibacillus profundi]